MSEKITIERLSYSDAGVGHLSNGKVVFVPGTCPGDEVEVQVTEEKKRLGQPPRAPMREYVEVVAGSRLPTPNS